MSPAEIAAGLTKAQREAEIARHLADCDPSDLGKEAAAIVAEAVVRAILQETNHE